MSIKREYNFDQVGEKDMYLLHHEEIGVSGREHPRGTLYPLLHDLRQSYLTHMKCLENVGMLSTTPVEFEGQQIAASSRPAEGPASLPDPASLGPRTHGKTNIGCIFTGKK